MENSFLSSGIKQFHYYKRLGDETFEQLEFADLQKEFAEDSNSICIIVKHMVGNMLSRWTNFLTEDGEKPWRHRDQEFEDTYRSKEEMLRYWEQGWNCVFEALNPLTVKNLEQIVYIRNEGHTVTEAINRQLAHYAYHVGQIVLIGKMLKGGQWRSLSIARGKSEEFNSKKFSKEKK